MNINLDNLKTILNGLKIKINEKVDKKDLKQKQDKLKSGTNIKTINKKSILGKGNIEIIGIPPGEGFYSEIFNNKNNDASGDYSHAEGSGTTASGYGTHAEGIYTTASGSYSHTEGSNTKASENSSHAEGWNTTATNFTSHAQGHYNATMIDGGDSSKPTTGTAFVIGNGNNTNLSNAFSVQFDGTTAAAGVLTAANVADYAENFEWLDGNPEDEDRVGYFVTLDGGKIKIADSTSDYILGIVSGAPFVLGNGDCDVWNGMYLRDKYNRLLEEPAPKMEEIVDEETGEVRFEEIEGEFEGTRWVVNPKYDNTQPYISRRDRKEWDAVGMLGVLTVRQDGTLKKNGFAIVADGGIATESVNGYRVIEVIDDETARVIFR